MDFKGRLIEFVRRTGQNIDATEKWRTEHPDDEFNEVTHLINSLLGLVVLPTEKIFEKVIDHLDQAAVRPRGIPDWEISFYVEGESPPGDLPGLVSGLRHAVAHYDIQYQSDEANNITGVIFQVRPWGRQGRPVPPPWNATFKLPELYAFLKRLTHEIEKAYAKSTPEELTDEG